MLRRSVRQVQQWSVLSVHRRRGWHWGDDQRPCLFPVCWLRMAGSPLIVFPWMRMNFLFALYPGIPEPLLGSLCRLRIRNLIVSHLPKYHRKPHQLFLFHRMSWSEVFTNIQERLLYEIEVRHPYTVDAAYCGHSRPEAHVRIIRLFLITDTPKSLCM